MPALAVTQPNFPEWLDLHDADSPVDRQLASASAAAATVSSVLYFIQNDPATGTARTATTFPRPKHISAGAEVTAYEADIAALVTAMSTVTGVLNRLRLTATR